MKSIRLRHIILFLLMAVFITPIRAGILTDYLLGGALTLKNGRIDKYYFEGGFARAFETSATTDRFVFYYYNKDHLGNNRAVVNMKTGEGNGLITYSHQVLCLKPHRNLYGQKK